MRHSRSLSETHRLKRTRRRARMHTEESKASLVPRSGTLTIPSPFSLISSEATATALLKFQPSEYQSTQASTLQYSSWSAPPICHNRQLLLPLLVSYAHSLAVRHSSPWSCCLQKVFTDQRCHKMLEAEVHPATATQTKWDAPAGGSKAMEPKLDAPLRYPWGRWVGPSIRSVAAQQRRSQNHTPGALDLLTMAAACRSTRCVE
jgi:hypothetical protein